MTKLIPPRRNEVVTPEGAMTQRFSEYLEGVANSINTSTDNNEVENSLASASPAALSKALKDINNLEIEPNVSLALLARIIKRLDNIEIMQTIDNTVSVNTAIQSTFDRRYALLVS